MPRAAHNRAAGKPKPPKRQPGKRGRPKGSGTVLTPHRRREILAILTVGGSRNDAADYVGIDRGNLETAKLEAHHPDFLRQLKRAEARGKAYHLRRVHDADAWQASAWMLERKYRAEFGRNPPPVEQEKPNDPTAVPARKYVYEVVTSTHPKP
mgnify:CR=1 FL=1